MSIIFWISKLKKTYILSPILKSQALYDFISDGDLKGEAGEELCKIPTLSKSAPFSYWVWRNEVLISEIETVTWATWWHGET